VKPTPVDANEPGEEGHGEGDDWTDDATAEEEAAPQNAPAAPNILIPNVFSPQGDGINDRLKVVGDHYQRVSVRIISARTDAVVFKANNLEDQWNGRDLNNVPCEEGYYFYAIEITGLDGLTYSMGEVIKLFR
jgi:gliding motility-associated-like protein